MRKTYTITGKRGIDDLKGLLGDFQTEWWTPEDWAKHETAKESNRAFNEAYIAELKEKGQYGEEYQMSISFEHNPLLDEPSFKLSSAGGTFMILDLRKE